MGQKARTPTSLDSKNSCRRYATVISTQKATCGAGGCCAMVSQMADNNVSVLAVCGAIGADSEHFPCADIRHKVIRWRKMPSRRIGKLVNKIS